MEMLHFDDPHFELFTWSVLLNRKEMAMVFWEHCKVNTRVNFSTFTVHLHKINYMTCTSTLYVLLHVNVHVHEHALYMYSKYLHV